MKLTDVCFSYGDKVILNRFTLVLPDRGITALAGPSGCGKTTLLRLIAGLETPQSGSIVAPPLSNISILFQENRLFPGFSASRQIEAVLPKEQSSLPWLRAVGLEGEEDTLPENLSGGMQRRLSLARCLAYGQDKELILLDEPFSGVDPDRIHALVALLRHMNIPVIFTAHDKESLSLADTVFHFEGLPLSLVEQE